MKQFFRTIKCGVLGAFLMLGLAAPLTFTSCENEHPEINLELKSDYSGIIDAINKTNTALADKLAVIESALKEGTLKNTQALDAIKSALSSMEGTVAQKLAAIEEAIKGQTLSLETALALIQTAMEEGFASLAEGQELMTAALDAIDGTLEDKLAAINDAIEDQTLALETKLGLIETAVTEGFASIKEGQEMIVDAIESLEGTLDEKLEALDKAIKAQTATLATKLAAIEAAVKAGFADNVKALGLIKDAVKAMDGTLKQKLAELKEAVDDQTLALSDKLFAIQGALEQGFVDVTTALKLINDALGPDGAIAKQLGEIVEALGEDGALATQLEALVAAIEGEGGTNDMLEDIVDALVGSDDPDTGDHTDGLIDVIGVIAEALAGTEDEDGIQDVLEDIADLLQQILDAINNQEQGGGDTPDDPEVPVGPFTPENPSGVDEETGVAYVEMGDGLRWAISNVGANSPEEVGNYFAWGEVKPKDTYLWSNYKWAEIPSDTGDEIIDADGHGNEVGYKYITKYTYDDYHSYPQTCGGVNWYDENNEFCGDGLTELEIKDDAAVFNMGGSWRMPSWVEISFFTNKNKCEWERTTYKGVDGYTVTSKVPGYEGNQLFFPISNYGNYTTNSHKVFLWTYSHSNLLQGGRVSRAGGLAIGMKNATETECYRSGLSRDVGYVVRGVMPVPED